MKTRSHACFVFAMLFIFSTMACAASEVSLAEDEDSGELYINMPVTGEATLTLTKDQLDENVTKFNVYDDGGKLGDYSKNANAILNIVVPEGYKMEVSGRALTEYFPKRTGLNDVLYIYDGSKELYQGGGRTGYDEDDGWWVGFASIDAVKSSGNKLTIKFQSNETEEFYGFTLNVRVFGPKHKYDVRLASSSDRIVDYDWTPYRVGSNGGEFMCRPCPALAGEEVTVFFESFYKDGYVLSALESVNLNERNGETVMAENNQLTFIMPADDVLLYPSLETLRSISVSENSGATVKVPESGAAFSGGNAQIEVYPKFGYQLDNVVVEMGTGRTFSSMELDEAYPGSGRYNFTLKRYDVTVRPSVSKIVSTKGELKGKNDKYINMPKTGAVAVTIPASVKSFKVYDDGGKDGSYSNNANGKLLLTAPDGYRMKISGSAVTRCEAEEACDAYVTVSDGDGTHLYRSFCDIDIGDDYVHYLPTDIGTYTSSGNKITLEFVSNSASVEDGFEFTVTLEKIGKHGAITIAGNVATIDGYYEGDDAFDIAEPISVDEVKLDRVFPVSYDGYYTTLLLPFSINLDRVKGIRALYELNYVRETQNTLTVEMTPVDEIKANTPYFASLNKSSLSFEGPVTLEVTSTPEVEKNGWAFVGTYAYKKWAEDDPELSGCNGSCVFGYAAEKIGKFNIGQFVKVGAGASIAPMRAYLLKLGKAKKVASPSFVARSSVASVEKTLPDHIDIVIDEGRGETLFVGRVNTHTGEFSKNRYNYIFDLKGRRIGNEVDKARGYYVKKLPRNY